MTGWILDYDGAALTLRVPEGEAEALPYSAFYKLSLRRYIAKREDGLFLCKPALTYRDRQRVISLCEAECAKRNAALTVFPALAEYIQGRGNYLEQRFRLGVEIKNRAEKLLPRFKFRLGVGGHCGLCSEAVPADYIRHAPGFSDLSGM